MLFNDISCYVFHKIGGEFVFSVIFYPVMDFCYTVIFFSVGGDFFLKIL